MSIFLQFGLSQQQFQILQDLLIQPLKSKGAQVFIFGSRAKGQFHPFSDIDILYIESPKYVISVAEISKIKEDLEESALTVKVDVVNIVNLASSYSEDVHKYKVAL
ncbi:MAG: nucleotidyltransferase family protein [Pseudobdellovibrionaceae bacterium]